MSTFSPPWERQAAELARWTWVHMVNRSDVFGGYHPIADRGKIMADGRPLGKTTTRPAKSKRGQVTLTDRHLVRHYRGAAVEHIVGLHSTSPENTSRWGAGDIDCHGPGGNDPDANFRAALAWHGRLKGLGIIPLLTDSNGAGGFQLLSLFDQPVATPRVFSFMRWLVSDHAAYGLPHAPETFPKQPSIPAGRYGNWLRLPGRHHTREHWSRVWDGGRWLEGEAAAEYILALRGAKPYLIPPWAARAEDDRPRPRARAGGYDISDVVSRRIDKYMSKLPNRGEAQGRDDVGYLFACFLVRDMALADAEALVWLERWDSGNRPPKGEVERKKWVTSAHAYGQHEYGSGRARRATGQGVRS